MDTKPLEVFAKDARRELLRTVEGRLNAVLASSSVARSEQPETVAALEHAIEGHGRAHVIDRAAYTWFNRIIALRFMDVNGYTPAGVVSPVPGQETGLPEVLADAKRGDIDTEAVTSQRIISEIIGLLDGSRRSTDPEGEAYGLLLTEYCKHWHTYLPFMFATENDFTELLIPTGLLADDSVLSRAREVLTEDVCRDVEVIGWLYQFYISERKAEVFDGFSRKQKAGAEEIPAATQLFTPHWIVRYLVENSLGRLWMLNRPASQLINHMDYYIAPVDDVSDFLRINGPEDLTVIDPACGSGHMLTYAFDLLYAIYEEEGYAPSEIPSLILKQNLHGTEIDERAGALAAFALTMKARAKDRRFMQRQIEPKICVIEPISFSQEEMDYLVTASGDRHEEEAFWQQFADADVLGSLIQPDAELTSALAAHLESLRADLFHTSTIDCARLVIKQAQYLSRAHSVVIANPPYMGAKNMNPLLAEYAKSRFPDTKSDLFAMFVERCLEMVPQGGFTGLMTPFVWMFIASYQKLRTRVVEHESITTLVQLEYSGFDGATVPICAYVLRRGRTHERGAFVRLSDFVGPAVQAPRALEIIHADRSRGLSLPTNGMERHLYRISSSEFTAIPGSPIAYWLSDAMRDAFSLGRPLRSVAEPKAGMHGGDINRFARLWYEVSKANSCLNASTTSEFHSSGRRWAGLNKGGDFRKWYGNQEYVLAFDSETYAILASSGNKLPSRSYYFLPSVSWTKVSSGAPSFRYYPNGFIFDVSGTPVFADERTLDLILASANSSAAERMLEAVAPTLNFEINQVASISIIEPNAEDNWRENLRELVTTSKADWDDFETSWGFSSPSWLNEPKTNEKLTDLFERWSTYQSSTAREQRERELKNDRYFIQACGLQNETQPNIPLHRVTLKRNVEFRFGPGKSGSTYKMLEQQEFAKELISYAVGCMFGRYSLEKPGLVLADQGSTLQDFLDQIPAPKFMPDADNVIPIMDDGWFKDDIVEQFRVFLRVAFGATHFEENLRFLEEALSVETIRDYFVSKGGRSKFYDDHVKTYKKRPIYWMFSSPNGSFNALVYLHRYTPATVSRVLNDYLREYQAKLAVALERANHAAVGGSAKEQKEADHLRKVLTELHDYEHDVLYPLAIKQVDIDLDDGVLVNYLRLRPALHGIDSIDKQREKVGGWKWPTNQLS